MTHFDEDERWYREQFELEQRIKQLKEGPFYIYPGTFCPPTWGHFKIVERLSQILPNLHITCGINPKKQNNWFTPEECVELWKSYPLPENITISTLENVYVPQDKFNRIILILGIRNKNDYQYANEVMNLNREKFGINMYLFVPCECGYENVSSTLARNYASKLNFNKLRKIVSPMVVSKLLEHVQD